MNIVEVKLRKELEELRWGIVANAGIHSRAGALPRWVHVADATGFSPTSSRELCWEAGFDPDELVGGTTTNEGSQ